MIRGGEPDDPAMMDAEIRGTETTPVHTIGDDVLTVPRAFNRPDDAADTSAVVVIPSDTHNTRCIGAIEDCTPFLTLITGRRTHPPDNSTRHRPDGGMKHAIRRHRDAVDNGTVNRRTDGHSNLIHRRIRDRRDRKSTHLATDNASARQRPGYYTEAARARKLSISKDISAICRRRHQTIEHNILNSSAQFGEQRHGKTVNRMAATIQSRTHGNGTPGLQCNVLGQNDSRFGRQVGSHKEREVRRIHEDLPVTKHDRDLKVGGHAIKSNAPRTEHLAIRQLRNSRSDSCALIRNLLGLANQPALPILEDDLIVLNLISGLERKIRNDGRVHVIRRLAAVPAHEPPPRTRRRFLRRCYG